MKEHEHKYEKLDEGAAICKICGAVVEIKTLIALLDEYMRQIKALEAKNGQPTS